MRERIIRDLAEFLVGHSSLEDFQGRVVSSIQDVLDSHEQDLITIVDEIDADLIQLSEGLIDEKTLHERIEGYLNKLETVNIDVGILGADRVTAASSSDTIQRQMEITGPVSDLRLRHVFA